MTICLFLANSNTEDRGINKNIIIEKFILIVLEDTDFNIEKQDNQ